MNEFLKGLVSTPGFGGFAAGLITAAFVWFLSFAGQAWMERKRNVREERKANIQRRSERFDKFEEPLIAFIVTFEDWWSEERAYVDRKIGHGASPDDSLGLPNGSIDRWERDSDIEAKLTGLFVASPSVEIRSAIDDARLALKTYREHAYLTETAARLKDSVNRHGEPIFTREARESFAAAARRSFEYFDVTVRSIADAHAKEQVDGYDAPERDAGQLPESPGGHSRW